MTNNAKTDPKRQSHPTANGKLSCCSAPAFALLLATSMLGTAVAPVAASGGSTTRFSCPTSMGPAEITFNDSAGVIAYVGEQELYPEFSNSSDGAVQYVLSVDANVWTFQNEDNDGLSFRQNQDAAVPCESLAQLPGFELDEDMVSAVGNFSLGGNVRAGPGMDFASTDSLPLGEPVSLVSRTGIQMDGFEWFEIEYSEGLRGFQWGGIMCSNALHIVGLYDPCPPELPNN